MQRVPNKKDGDDEQQIDVNPPESRLGYKITGVKGPPARRFKDLRDAPKLLWTIIASITILIVVTLYVIRKIYLGVAIADAESESDPIYQGFDRSLHYCHQHPWVVWLLSHVHTAALDNYKAAQGYYNDQLPAFLEAATANPIHRNFADSRYIASVPKDGSISYYDLVKLRAESMVTLYQEKKLDGFKIEKNKCEMTKFFMGNEIPVAGVIGFYQSIDQFLQEAPKHINSKDGYEKAILKACHLTSGNAQSTMMLSYHDLEDPQRREKLRSWLELKWDFQAIDWERTWHPPMDKLTDVVAINGKGFMLQRLHPKSSPEIKVQTLFGKVFMVNAESDESILLNGRDRFESYHGFSGKILYTPTFDGTWDWIVEEGHIPRITYLAELVSKAIGADELRVDIFITQGDPDAAVVNEISLSSGLDMGVYFAYYAKMWASVLTSGKVSVRNTELQVAEQKLQGDSLPKRPQEPPFKGDGPIWDTSPQAGWDSVSPSSHVKKLRLPIFPCAKC